MSPMFWVSDGKELSSLCLFMLRAVLVTSHEKPYLLGKIRVAWTPPNNNYSYIHYDIVYVRVVISWLMIQKSCDDEPRS